MPPSPPCGVVWRPEWELTTSGLVPTHYVDARFTVWPTTKHENVSVGLCLLPKAGSSTLKRALFAALVRQGIRAVRPDFDLCPHRQPAIANLVAPARAFIIVRHPSMRLASAYREIARRGLWHRLPTQRPNTSFAALVRALVTTPPMQLDLHLRPVLYTCGLVSGQTYTVLRYENWTGLVATLKRDFALRDLGYRASGTEERAHLLYSRALAQQVNTWSRLDRQLLGYDPWLPGQSISWNASLTGA